MQKMIGVVALIVVIVAAIVIAVMSRGGPSDAETKAKAELGTYMLASTLTEVKMPQGEFMELPMDPKTGFRTDKDGRALATVMPCMACGAKVAAAPLSDEARAAYVCLACKKKPYEAQ